MHRSSPLDLFEATPTQNPDASQKFIHARSVCLFCQCACVGFAGVSCGHPHRISRSGIRSLLGSIPKPCPHRKIVYFALQPRLSSPAEDTAVSMMLRLCIAALHACLNARFLRHLLPGVEGGGISLSSRRSGFRVGGRLPLLSSAPAKEGHC